MKISSVFSFQLRLPLHYFYNFWIIFCGILFLVYFPIQAGLILWKNRRNISANTFYARYIVLVMPNKMQYFFFFLGSHPYLEEIAFSLPRRFDGWNAKQ
jgi:hypothetical protein